MADSQNRSDWSGGINNRSDWRSVPAKFVRDAVNVDPNEGPGVSLRTGYEAVYRGGNIRGVLAVNSYLLIADGSTLLAFDTRNSTATALATIAGAGRFNGAVLNDELFFCTENETFRFKEGHLRPWGVTTLSYQPVPSVVAGGLRAGEYQCAATFVDAYGDEGGTTAALVITVPEGSGLQFDLPTPPAGGAVRLYVGNVQGATLYLQFEGTGTVLITQVDDSSARLETMHMRAPMPADYIEAHNSVLLLVEDRVMWLTRPMRPHLRQPMTGFYQYPKTIEGVLSADNGVFVSAGVTYHLTNVETNEPVQNRVFDFPAIPGSFTRTPDDLAAWMTRYGLAKSDGKGRAVLMSEANFLPQLAVKGRSGILETNGNQLVVTTLTPGPGGNPLAASDYYEVEIVPNE
jgi:hypothetical protein